MERLTNRQKILRLLSVGHWWTRRQLALAQTGKELTRHKATEYQTLMLARKGLIRAERYGRKIIYSIGGSKNHIEHGLMCTEVFARLYISNPNCEIIPEAFFRREAKGVVPEAGLAYRNKTALLIEVSTADNGRRKGLISRKVNSYKKHLKEIESAIDAAAVILFVIDMPLTAVKQYARLCLKDTNYIYFTDYQTFRRATLGAALVSPIYFMADGHLEGLRDV